MELFGRKLSLEQIIGFVECIATPDEDLVHRAALEIIAALRESQRRERGGIGGGLMSEIRTTENFCHEQCEFFARDGKCPANGLPERCQLYRLRRELISMKGRVEKITNMDFPRLCELAEADRDGRVVILPCKVGDTVYVLHDKKILHQKVWRVIVCHANDDIFAELSFNTGATEQCKYSGGFKFYFDDIGKTVFLTRAEAEAALVKEEETP